MSLARVGAPLVKERDTYPYAYHIALDGNGINGFEGMAGVCLFLFDPGDCSFAYKIKYYDGIAAGHAVSVSPSGKLGFLGSASQQLLFYDAQTLDEVGRISTLRFEPTDTTLRGSTHVVWLDERTFITAIGDYYYRFDVERLEQGERLAPHRLVGLPHGMKRTASGRFVVCGSMDHPERGPAKEVGVLDLHTGETHRLPLPTTCWHLTCHPDQDLFYPVSFRVSPQDGHDYVEWGMAFAKEYAYEVDASERKVLRHWATSRETPAHINSDVAISDQELIFCNGGSQSIICIDRDTLSGFRVIDELPSLAELARRPRQVATQVFDSFARGGFFTNARLFFGALRVSRFSLLDSVYACAVSRDQSLLFSGNRGLNRITIYKYPEATVLLQVELPGIQSFVPVVGKLADSRLGLHHSYLISPPAPALPPATGLAVSELT
jgi:hypothetical protein